MIRLSFLCIILLVSACALPARDTGSAHMFTLDAFTTDTAHSNAHGTLMVYLPNTRSQLDTSRIALIREESIADYYAEARWAEFVPNIVQSTFITSFEHSQLFDSVISDETHIKRDYNLTTEIRDFHARHTEKEAPTAVVTIVFTLIDAKNQKTIAHSILSESTKATSSRLQDINQAFNTSFTEVQKEMIQNVSDTLNTLNN